MISTTVASRHQPKEKEKKKNSSQKHRTNARLSTGEKAAMSVTGSNSNEQHAANRKNAPFLKGRKNEWIAAAGGCRFYTRAKGMENCQEIELIAKKLKAKT